MPLNRRAHLCWTGGPPPIYWLRSTALVLSRATLSSRDVVTAMGRLITGNSALCQPDTDPCPPAPCPAYDMRHSGLAGHQKPAQPKFEGAALLNGISKVRMAAEDSKNLHEVHRVVLQAGCEMMGPRWRATHGVWVALAEVAEYFQDLSEARTARRQKELKALGSFGHFVPICHVPVHDCDALSLSLK